MVWTADRNSQGAGGQNDIWKYPTKHLPSYYGHHPANEYSYEVCAISSFYGWGNWGLERASKVTELVRCQSQDTNAGPSDSQVCEILAISGNMCILLSPGRHNGRIPGSLSSLKYGTLCTQSHFLVPQGHPLPALFSALVFSGNGLASFILQSDTGLQLCPFSILLPAGADQGMRKTSLPAGMAASLSLLNSTQDMWEHHTGTEASSWLWESAVKTARCDARCLTRMNSLPLERDLLYPSAKRQSEKLVC